ncbi:hypothetical protein SAMN05216196_10185 [Lutimaribacter pacificus]|uniref:BAAT / Acyl-CoA thioester hydrolase C terminal n=1 Tax=Lutimaribacter pacificus TaxID=391948 RepID=A0A1H0AAA5_9RHOB|nr:acyl-CoA thioester hydrolase/BAAT C-terminal domain-containing protein [Lutimaribacter pacificus]SDN30377.1 hypothetical protein SAMN05216196_10185 [Lutimaribacter pacificus]SHJ71665.1 BAAT / Acyl-CoA thioester hydrolase C terminal [Lutimaribacter pacificus]
MRWAAALLLLSAALLAGVLAWRMIPPAAGIAPRLDAGAGRAPVVLLLGPQTGGRPGAGDPLPQELRNAGFRVARVGWIGMPGTPARLDRIALDPFDSYLEGLAARGDVDRRCLYVAGASRGAELALLIASGNGAVGAVAAVAPAHVAFQAPGIAPLRQSAWRRGGAPVAFVPFRADLRALRGLVTGDRFAGRYARALQDAAAVARAAIPVERIAGPVLLIGAARDEVWPSARMAQAVADRLAESAFAHEVGLTIVDAGHDLLARGDVRAGIVTFLTGAAQRAGCLPPVAR